jgi:translocation and assembly module TamA
MPSAAARHLATLLFVLSVGGCGLFREAQEVDPFADVEQDEGLGIRYAVEFEGPIDAELRAALESASSSLADRARPPASEFLLERRAEADLGNLTATLRSYGYYEGTVAYEIRGDVAAAEGDRSVPLVGAAVEDLVDPPAVRLVFEITPGPRYSLAQADITVVDPEHGFAAPTAGELGLEWGQPAAAAPVLEAHRELVRRALRAGHPFARAGDLAAVIDMDQDSMEVELPVRTGPSAEFAEASFTGAEGVNPRLLRRRVPFRPGDRFDPDEVAEGRRALVETDLFASVIVNQGEELDAEGRLPVTYELTQRPHRSIGAGIGFRTDEGPNVSFFWENRNLFTGAERLRTELYLSRIRQEVTARFRKPDIGARRRNLLADASLRREDTDAYKVESAAAGIGVERVFRPGLATSLGVAYRYGRIEEQGEEDDLFGLLSLPARLDWDFSNDLLDPTGGGRLTVTAAPYTDTLGFGTNFFKSHLTHTRYIQLTTEPWLVAALRGSVGSLIGASRDDVPADERFYSGGGGSVRGFAYQFAGPLDDSDNPIGGRSLLEFNAELRYRATESIGLVAFLDAGTVYDAVVPDFSEELLFGTGLGLRYATPIGPLRLDIGVPVNRRDADDLYQIYISIGQAF